MMAVSLEEQDSGLESMAEVSKDLTPEESPKLTLDENNGAVETMTPPNNLSPEKAKPKCEDDEDDEDIEEETLGERLWGLTEMFPDSVRNVTHKFFEGSKFTVSSIYHLSRVSAWIFFSSSAILVAPLIFEIERCQMEEAQKFQQKQALLGPGVAPR